MKIKQNSISCPKRGEASPASKLTEKKVLEIRQKRAAGQSQKSLAKEYDVGRVTIARVVYFHSWAHVGGPRPGRGSNGPNRNALARIWAHNENSLCKIKKNNSRHLALRTMEDFSFQERSELLQIFIDNFGKRT